MRGTASVEEEVDRDGKDEENYPVSLGDGMDPKHAL